jgi:hypothetical protein
MKQHHNLQRKEEHTAADIHARLLVIRTLIVEEQNAQ